MQPLQVLQTQPLHQRMQQKVIELSVGKWLVETRDRDRNRSRRALREKRKREEEEQ